MDQARVTEQAAVELLGRRVSRQVSWYPDEHPGWQRLESAMKELARNPR